MNIFLVTFSLRNQYKDYEPLFVALRGNALQWWHFIEQSYVVTTTHDVNTYAQQLLPHIETTDSLLVVEVNPHQFQGWLPKSAWEWLHQVSDKKKSEIDWLPFLLPPSK